MWRLSSYRSYTDSQLYEKAGKCPIVHNVPFMPCFAKLILFCYLTVSQRFNADYELTARQGADTLAYIALLEEKLRPALVKELAAPCCSLLCITSSVLLVILSCVL